ncbi:AAA family ATPase [Leifsonia sp. Leaf264]|uniref:AAA family ATPase n=1 Tax=Leifsonia sp. Leaf264 TaxID=1736314 RepID=UPI0006F60E81|nr:AAA family ATPase [Leifsonia sp. Leaf264]KQO98831.1 hypothetical protein ASF30_12270 [Leifsonia sp. Leaf264]
MTLTQAHQSSRDLAQPPRVYLTRGIPGSGKTTWAKLQEASSDGHTVRVNRDDLRFDMFGTYWGPEIDENQVTLASEELVRQAVAAGHDVILDNTHVKTGSLHDTAAFANSLGAIVHVIDFPIPVDVAIARDAARIAAGGRGVGEGVIRTLEKVRKDNHDNLPVGVYHAANLRAIPSYIRPTAQEQDITPRRRRDELISGAGLAGTDPTDEQLTEALHKQNDLAVTKLQGIVDRARRVAAPSEDQGRLGDGTFTFKQGLPIDDAARPVNAAANERIDVREHRELTISMVTEMLHGDDSNDWAGEIDDLEAAIDDPMLLPSVTDTVIGFMSTDKSNDWSQEIQMLENLARTAPTA